MPFVNGCYSVCVGYAMYSGSMWRGDGNNLYISSAYCSEWCCICFCVPLEIHEPSFHTVCKTDFIEHKNVKIHLHFEFVIILEPQK